ncbi:phosphopantothenoylcysteine decarboxylase [Malassezia yamatoensis]|uniref:Phosphopantothenoylcysteine decarboxylase n=1 Tax=Malassezia yamatoensis TaxID=253288 RepID=A0AAJ6CH96_9BASI|nr:phosphopantothenoylcysteine decarboxylase [Malassezia yamatoensis]
MSTPKSLQSMYAPLTRPPSSERPLHIVLICTGSVASVKIPLMVEELLRYENVCVQVIATKDALHFFDRDQLHSEKFSVKLLAKMNQAAEHQSQGRTSPIPPAPRFCLWTDTEEWSAWNSLGDPVLHIEVCK